MTEEKYREAAEEAKRRADQAWESAAESIRLAAAVLEEGNDPEPLIYAAQHHAMIRRGWQKLAAEELIRADRARTTAGLEAQSDETGVA
jgi:hypothetical protein